MSKEQQPPESEVPPEDRFPVGRSIVNRIRSDINQEMGPFIPSETSDVFALLYLTERDGCLPEQLLDEDLVAGIRNLYYCVLDGLRSELKERLHASDFLWVIVDASYEDATDYVLMTDERVLLAGHSKAWHFYWDSEDDMAKEMEDWYQGAASRLLPEAHLRAEEPGTFNVTLQLERAFTVAAPNRDDALDKAIRWENNEDDEQVTMEYEEVLGSRIERTPSDAGA